MAGLDEPIETEVLWLRQRGASLEGGMCYGGNRFSRTNPTRIRAASSPSANCRGVRYRRKRRARVVL